MVPMISPLDLIQESITHLKNNISNTNKATTIDGLLLRHFCTHFVPNGGWAVCEDPGKWITDSDTPPDQAPYMSTLGFLIANKLENSGYIDENVVQRFAESLDRLKQRKNIFQNLTSWIFQPAIVLGISLGIKTINSEPLKQWMILQVKEGVKFPHGTLFQKLIYLYVGALLDTPINLDLPSNPIEYSLFELSITIWLIEHGIISNFTRDWVEMANAQVLSSLLDEIISDANEDFRYAILLDVVMNYIYTRSHLPSEELLIRVLQGFEPAMERWQPTWKITNEYHVQAILWLMLCPYFEDIRYEDNLPKLGRSGHRYDLGIPSLGKLVEVKYIRKKDDFQKIINEVGIDAAQITTQVEFREFVVFVYDETCAVENYSWTHKALINLNYVKEVIIVSAPSTARNSA